MALGAILGGASMAAQPPRTTLSILPEISFRFERPGLAIPKFALQIKEDGSGTYAADEMLPGRPDGTAATARHIDRPIALSAKATETIFAADHALKNFTAACASTVKNIADTGKKTLAYSGPDGEGSCVYNYSQDKRVVMLTDLFLAIAHTMDIGRKLDFDHRFDRLGLDEATASLVDEVSAGRAAELGTIAPTLRSIAEDSDVMERVRLRAARLLEQTQTAK